MRDIVNTVVPGSSGVFGQRDLSAPARGATRTLPAIAVAEYLWATVQLHLPHARCTEELSSCESPELQTQGPRGRPSVTAVLMRPEPPVAVGSSAVHTWSDP